MKVIIEVEVKNCIDCPCCREFPNWFLNTDYFCKLADQRLVASNIEYPCEMPDIPDWCPAFIIKEGI